MTDALTEEFVRTHCEKPYFVRATGQWVRCQSSDPSVCRKCSSLRSLDKKRIIGSGCNPSALDGITEEMLEPYSFYFVTFTAPSFGKIREGIPLDPRRYEYRKQVEWNQSSTALFNATMVSLSRSLPDSEFAFVREWQKRGAIHFHGIIRVPKDYDRSETIDAIRLCKATESNGITWGRQMDVQVVRDALTASVRYMSKVVAYTAKHQGGDRGALPQLVADFYGRLDSHARKLTCNRKGCDGTKLCKGRAHRSHGYGGNMLSTSKGWSLANLTFGALKQQRSAYAATLPQASHQMELEEAARLAKEDYDNAFAGMTSTARTL